MSQQLSILDLETAREIEYLLPSFLESPADYQAAVGLWNQMIEEIGLTVGSQHHWTPWGEMPETVTQEDWDLYPSRQML